MATIPGGLFDSNINSSVSADQGGLISSFLTSLGLTDANLTFIETGASGFTSAVGDTVSASTFTVTSGGSTNIVLAGSTDQILTITGNGTAELAGNFGGGSDSVLGGTDSAELHALTLPETGVETTASGDSLTGGGPAISDAQASYLYNVASDFGAGEVMLNDIVDALELLSNNGDTPASELETYFGRLDAAPDSSLTEIELDTGDATSDILMITHLADLPDVTYVFTGMEKLILVGEGSARIGGDEAAMAVGDSTNQFITGGTGDDTLVGGGGQDTLAGGEGSDVFGFNKIGHYTIQDFAQGTDALAFQIDGVTSAAGLGAYLTEVEIAGGNSTYHFGADASITLVGVTTTDILDDLMFNIS